MRVFKVFAVQVLAILLFLLVSYFIGRGREAGNDQRDLVVYNSGWEIEVNGEKAYWEELPEQVEVSGDLSVTLSKKLDSSLMRARCLGFYTSHQSVSVYAGNVILYELQPEAASHSKTPGNTWNFVDLEKNWEGHTLTVILRNCYGDDTLEIPDFYYGAKDSIIMWFIESHIGPFLLSLIILLMGVVLVIVYFCARNTMGVGEEVLWLGLFAVFLALWSALECQIITLFFDQALLLNRLVFLMLKLVLIPILQFVMIIYGLRDDKVMKGICIASIVDFWVTGVLQLFGVLDYRETLWVTQTLLLAAVVYVLFRTALIFLEKGERDRKSWHAIWVHAVCVLVVCVTVLLDFISYRFLDAIDSARFTRFGMLLYIVLLAIQILNDSVRLIRAGKRVDELRVEAEVDVLTKLKNRLSFEKDLSTLQGEDLEEYGIMVCDLNNLKFFNDCYGHSIGDYYIIICSEVIQDSFGCYGGVYRIGGDEFCGILKGLDEEQVRQMRDAMLAKLGSLRGTPFKEAMRIAVGYAKYDKSKDSRLQDTEKRADALMYQHKKRLKKMSF